MDDVHPMLGHPDAPDGANWFNGMSPETFVNPSVSGLLGGLATLPQRAIENSQHSLNTGTYDPGPTLEAATLPMGTGAIAGVPVRAGEAVLGAGPIRAYHGSPHDFEKFDLSKIGTGEGAQAYGHGLYFAENEGVAKSYRDTLGGDTLITPKGTVFDPMTLEHMNVRSRAHSNGSNLDATIETAQNIAQSDSPVAAMAQRDLEKLQALKAEGGVTRNKGSMYEVNINADPEHFLDWDKPLSEQHPNVRRALFDAGATNPRNIAYGEERDRYLKPLEQEMAGTEFSKYVKPHDVLTGNVNMDAVSQSLSHDPEKLARIKSIVDASKNDPKLFDNQDWNLKGKDAYFKLADTGPSGSTAYGVADSTKEPIATAALNQRGIPGIKYLDQGSRAAGDGSRNYVVFNDKLINIVKKYAAAGMALPPAIAAEYKSWFQPVDHDPFESQ